MLTYFVFIALLALTCALAFLKGNGDDRIGAVALVLAAATTIFADALTAGFIARPETSVALIDLGLAVPLIYLAMRSSLFWPLWAAGFHLVAIATHIAAWVDMQTVPMAYALSIGFWGFPTVGALTLSLIIRTRYGSRSVRAAA